MFSNKRSFVGALLIVALAFVLLGGSPPPTAALGEAEITPGRAAVLDLRPEDAFTRVPRPPARFGPSAAAPAATFIVSYDHGFDAFPQARAAFQAAVDIWAGEVSSSVPITVNATFSPAGATNLGSAGSVVFASNFPGAPLPNIAYPIALANKLAGKDLRPQEPDIVANFNSLQSAWYFGTDGNTPAQKVDFETVVLHELGHGLGFDGSMSVLNGFGSWGLVSLDGVVPITFDRFARNGAGQILLSTALFANPSLQLAAQLQGGSVLFDGPNERAANGGSAARLYAPRPWVEGKSFAHLDETTYPDGSINSLMTPFLDFSESIHDVGPISRGIFRDIGWESSASTSTTSMTTSTTSMTTSTTSMTTATTQSTTSSTTATTTRATTSPPATFTLSLTFLGAGHGAVQPNIAAVQGPDCSLNVCAGTYLAGTVVLLAPQPDGRSTFTGWGGSCSGTGSCTLTMDANRSATVTFNPACTSGKKGKHGPAAEKRKGGC